MAKKQSNEDKLINAQLVNQAAQVANMAAQLEFQKERMRLLELPEMQTRTAVERDRLAFDKGQAEWENAFKEASITGTYKGQPTIEYLTSVARLTGVINGQQTIEGKLTDAQIAQMNATILNTQRLTDLEYERTGIQVQQWDAEHQMALTDQQAKLTGFIDGLPTFERQQWEANQGFNYINLLSTLRGPENAFKMLEVLEASPDAMKIMGARWAGQYSATASNAAAQGLQPVTPQNMIPGYGTATSGQLQAFPTSTPAAPPTDLRVMGAEAPGGFVPLAYQPGYTIDPAGSQAAVNAYNYEPTPQGGTMVYPPGIPAPNTGMQVSTQVPLNPATQQNLTQQAVQANPGTMVDPNKINAHEYNRTSKYGQTLGWAGYEAAGWDKSAAQEMFQRALPKYGTSNVNRGTVQI